MAVLQEVARAADGDVAVVSVLGAERDQAHEVLVQPWDESLTGSARIVRLRPAF